MSTSTPTQEITQSNTQSNNNAEQQTRAEAKAEAEALAEERRKEVAEYERVSQIEVAKFTCFLRARYSKEDLESMKNEEQYTSLYSEADFAYMESIVGFYQEFTVIDYGDWNVFEAAKQQCLDYIANHGGVELYYSYYIGGGPLTDEAKLRYGY